MHNQGNARVGVCTDPADSPRAAWLTRLIKQNEAHIASGRFCVETVESMKAGIARYRAELADLAGAAA
ncbi:hypothetical protein [Gordonia malaquae]|uniref:hypothetical protein n=1 Tax=Gordonia malaquae TaxID=410332 RepID=UPI0030FDFF33